MDDAVHQTTLSTISLLEARLLRLEQLLYGPAASPAPAQHESVAWRMGHLETRFSVMLSNVRVYGHLLQIYRAHPDLFRAAEPSDPPSQLSTDAVRSVVLASASSYTAALSSLTAIHDSSIPDASESATLISLKERMKAIQATQAAQAADMAELRRRSEVIIRSWYESSLLPGSQSMADMGSRVEGVERQVRRRERAQDEDKERT